MATSTQGQGSPGAVYIYQRQSPDSPWLLEKRLEGPQESYPTGFGGSLQLSGDTLALGVDGKVQLLERHHGGINAWGLLQEIDTPVGEASSALGALDGETLAVVSQRYALHQIRRYS